MDELLKALAAVALEVGAAEDALDQTELITARERVDTAEAGLAALRERWPELDARQRRVLGAAAGPIRQRLDATRARLPLAAQPR